MKKIYTVYQLNEKTNKLGNPYIGMSEDLITRAKTWKCKLKLDYIPKLIPLHTETDGQRCFNWEQHKRVEMGWRRETSYRQQKSMRKKAHVAASKSEKLKENSRKQGIRAVISGQLAMGRTLEGATKGGKTSGKNNVESGHLENVRSKIRVCDHCNKTIKGPSYFKWHGDNCKAKPN